MISITQVRYNIYSLMKLANKNGISIKLHWNKKVYKMTIEPTLELYVQKPWMKKKPIPKKGVVQMQTSTCECGNIKVNNVCIDKLCPIAFKGLTTITVSHDQLDQIKESNIKAYQRKRFLEAINK